MSRPPGVLTKKLLLLWAITIISVAALWGLARLDEFVPDDLVLIWDLNPLGTPRPEAFGALLAIGAFGVLCILGTIVLRIRDSDQTINLGSLLIALGSVGGADYEFSFI